MFITEEDYKVVIGDAALKVISQVSPENRANAEAEAQEEIAGYLRPKYDCDAIFNASGNARNQLILMMAIDIAVYHIFCIHNPQKLSDVRRERYERAVEWLKAVAAEQISIAGAPTLTGEQRKANAAFRITSTPKRHNHM